MTALSLLAWTCFLAFVQMLVAASGATLQVGLPTLAGNREHLPELTGWAGRAKRAHANMLESLVLFAALVLTAQVVNKGGDSMVVLGAQLFFWARLVYAIIYVIGLPWVRTAVWFVSIVGLAMIFLAIMR